MQKIDVDKVDLQTLAALVSQHTKLTTRAHLEILNGNLQRTQDGHSNYVVTPQGMALMRSLPGDPNLDSPRRARALEAAAHMILRKLLNGGTSSATMPTQSPMAAPEIVLTGDLSLQLSHGDLAVLAAAPYASRIVSLVSAAEAEGINLDDLDKAADLLMDKRELLNNAAETLQLTGNLAVVDDVPDTEPQSNLDNGDTRRPFVASDDGGGGEEDANRIETPPLDAPLPLIED